jgi:hypothetical protein
VRLDSEGDRAIDTACAAHPDHAPRLRAMVTRLRRVGLVPEPELAPPERIGRYRLLRRIGAARWASSGWPRTSVCTATWR